MGTLTRSTLVQVVCLTAGFTAVALAVPVYGLPTAPGAEPHVVLATGDRVPGFGTIGYGGMEVSGIDPLGRLLILGELSTGDLGLFWGDPTGLAPVWRSGQTPHQIFFPSLSPGGRVVATEVGKSIDGTLLLDSVAEIAPQYRRIMGRGDPTPDGNVICWVGGQARVNDAGTVAFRAGVVPLGDDCLTSPRFGDVILVASGDAVVVEVARTEYGGDELEIVGLLADDTVLFVHGVNRADFPDDVVASKGGMRSCPVRDAPSEPPLCAEPLRNTIAANAAGDVLGLIGDGVTDVAYRTQAGLLVPAVSPPEALGDGFVVASATAYGLLNAAGDTVMEVQWANLDTPGVTESGTVLFPANGAPRIVARAGLRGFNDAGQIALFDGTARRWTDGRMESIVTTGDAAPGGGVFASVGLEGARCLAADGRVAARAVNSEFRDGVVCADATGRRFIAGQGDAAPGGGTFENFYQCAFGGPDLYFVASTRTSEDAPSSTGLYRATDTRIERVVMPNELDADGLPVQGIDPNAKLATTPDGVVAARVFAVSGLGGAVVRRTPDGLLERVDLDPDVERGWIDEVVGFGLADSQAVVAAVHRRRSPAWALVSSAPDGPRTLTTPDDPRLADGPFAGFGEVLVSGNNAIFTAIATNGRSTVFGYDLGTNRLERLLPADPGFFVPRRLLDLTPAGDLLFEEVVTTDNGDPFPTAFFRFRGDQRELLLRRAARSDSTPVAINDLGNVLSYASESPHGAAWNALSLSGPSPGAVRCPAVEASTNAAGGSDGCQVVAHGESNWIAVTSLVTAFLLAAIRWVYPRW